ncbi:hypothetical protein BU198_25680 [Streptomyces sp. CBMA156]|nr:hypothetical protein [Streptomyces sp. CBMA156]
MEFADEALPVGELVDERRHLIDLACRMPGSAGEADGVVDEAYRRWYAPAGPEREGVGEPRAWLSRVVGGICRERLARPGRRRDGGPVPCLEAAGVERTVGEVLPGLSPAERAAFVPDDVAGTAPRAVAGVVGRSAPECSDPAERARRSLRARRGRATTPEERDAAVCGVREACAAQDPQRLLVLLAPDVTAFFDGGGKVRAPVRPVHGPHRVARSLLTLLAPARAPRWTAAPSTAGPGWSYGTTGGSRRSSASTSPAVASSTSGSSSIPTSCAPGTGPRPAAVEDRHRAPPSRGRPRGWVRCRRPGRAGLLAMV